MHKDTNKQYVVALEYLNEFEMLCLQKLIYEKLKLQVSPKRSPTRSPILAYKTTKTDFPIYLF